MKSIVHLRIADNVLNDKDCGYIEATIINGRITKIEEIERSPYIWLSGPTVGRTTIHLLSWLNKDFTGRHPEEYHQIRVPGGGWEGLLVTTMEDLKNILELAEV